MSYYRSSLAYLICGLVYALVLSSGGSAATVDFSRDVQPILSDKCFYCHGQDENHRKGDRRLDSREGALAEKDGIRAVVPGDLEKSDLVARILSTDADEVMPPRKEKKRLTDEQKETLKRWVAEGAKWGTHWAFVPPVKAAVPRLPHGGWATRNPIDSFVFERLQREQLQPSPEAGRETLLRRACLDLTGLPPTLEEVDRFMADTSPGAYEAQVDRLLGSSHYGERWGRHWLDAARYADTNGFEKDAPRSVWHYRDWVVDALNRDLPYNQFIIEQLAGDLLPGCTQQQRVATGFLRNSMINEEGGVDPEQFRMEAMFDRMEVIGKSVLGITIQCAQCHSHKFDPIPHEDYYRLFAYLNNDAEAQPVVYTGAEEEKRRDVLAQVETRERKLREAMPDWRERMHAWEEKMHSRPEVEWVTLNPMVDDISTGGQKYLPQADGAMLAAGFQPVKHEAKLTARTNLQHITAFRIEMLQDPNLPAGGPGRSHLGSFGLTEFKVSAAPVAEPGEDRKVVFSTALSDLEPPAETPVLSNFNEKVPKHRVIGPAQYAIDGNEETAWSNDIGPGRRNRDCTLVAVAESPLTVEGATELTIRLTQKHGGWNADDLHGNNLGRFRISATSSPDAGQVIASAELLRLLRIPEEKRTAADAAALFTHWRSSEPEAALANAEIEALWKGYPEGATQLELARASTMRETRLLQRGDWLKPAGAVQPGVPAFLHAMPADAPPNRLSLAKWLVDPKSPTAARVLVNRVWQHYFGAGIVTTSEDFGLQSSAPSHPELLDWLACDFMEHGWSLKHLHRLIVTSATYRQSSRVSPEGYQHDPYNALLARGSRLRVEGELVRDIQLAASGLLNNRVGGESVKPPAPAFLFLPPASYAPFPWQPEQGAERYRRALYTYRRRTTPYPLLSTFDTPEGNVSCVRRNRSNTPLQALVTLNEPMAMEAAQALARQTLEHGGRSDGARIEYAVRRCLSRYPSESELATLRQLLEREMKRIQEGRANPWKLAGGTSPENAPSMPEGTSPAELAAYTSLSRVLLNLDETITKE